jgi:hypothetical protein
VAEAIGAGMLTVGELRAGFAATRALGASEDRLSPTPDIGSPDDALVEPMARFLVDVPWYTIEGLVKAGLHLAGRAG